jgi:hypothetical protein
MPYIQASDVRKYLEDEASLIPDTELIPYINFAEDIVKEFTGRQWGNLGPIVDVFINVPEDDILHLSVWKPITVTVVGYIGSDSIQLNANEDYNLLPRGRIQLLEKRLISLPSLPSVAVKTFLDHWTKIEVTSTQDPAVPPGVLESTALIAALIYRQGVTGTSYFRSEKIGDYRYTMSDDAVKAGFIPQSVRLVLKQFAKRRVRTT